MRQRCVRREKEEAAPRVCAVTLYHDEDRICNAQSPFIIKL